MPRHPSRRPPGGRTGRPDVAEGWWDHAKIIIMPFKDRAAFDAWAHSPEYQETSKDRTAATDGVVPVAPGVG
ncbi:DUF1330 domain-containing protein [Streptomyces sp. NPDC020362]